MWQHIPKLAEAFGLGIPEVITGVWQESVEDPCPCGCGGRKIPLDDPAARKLLIEIPCVNCGTTRFHMAEWIEVPAHRIYVICARELRDDFDYIGENGKPVERAEISYRFVRKKDGKIFKWARFAPQYKGVYICAALEEI